MIASRHFSSVFGAPLRGRIRVAMGMRHLVFCLLAGGLVLVSGESRASPASSEDICLTFLSSGSSTSSPAQMGRRTVGANEAAGKAATLSLLLGVQTALGPAEDLSAKADNGTDDISALDIARYRTCKKDQALTLSALHQGVL